MLVRVVEDGRLGGAGRVAVVVSRDGVQQLGPGRGLERLAPLLDQPQAEVDVAEQLPLGSRPEGRAAAELARAAHVVEERRGEEQVGAQAWMEL